MKNMIKLISCFCYFIWQPVYAQKLYPKNDIRKCLNEYLYDIQATGNTQWDEANLHIWNLLSGEKICFDRDMKKIGIFGFEPLGSHQYTYIFLKYCDDYEILAVADNNHIRDYSEILDDLQDYFVRHPDLDKRLMPFYNKAMCDVYIENTQIDQLGPWFEWYETDRQKYIENNFLNSNRKN